MKAGRIARVKNYNYTLGLKLSSSSLAWAVIKRGTGRPELVEEIPGDVLDSARRAAQQKLPEPLMVFTYANDDAFAGSLAARDGLTREQHGAHVETIAAALAGEGFDIVICEVE